MVSIIIALYNGEDFIEKTIESCLHQSYQDFEIIIVDDVSTDDSVNRVLNLCGNENRIKLFRNEINQGFCKTVNFGVKQAQGEFILVMGQDDIILNKHLEVMLDYMKKDVAMVYCSCDLIDETDLLIDEAIIGTKSQLGIEDFVNRNPVSSCGAIQRKKYFEEAGGYPELKEFPNYGEWYLWIKMIGYGKIVYCNKIKSEYRRHSKNMTNSFVDKKTNLRLRRYWNECRKQILYLPNSGKIIRVNTFFIICFEELIIFLKGFAK